MTQVHFPLSLTWYIRSLAEFSWYGLLYMPGAVNSHEQSLHDENEQF